MFFNRKPYKDKIYGAVIGAVLGDALGVPFEFMKKEDINIYKINKIDGGGRWSQPKGTWSDDSSMLLCTIESLLNGYNCHDIGDKYVKWLYEGYCTPYGIVFDAGATVVTSIRKIRHGDYSGCDEEDKCGNGSLMRILPLALYLNKYPEDKFTKIKEVSSLTHSNILCVIGCAIYVELLINILKGQDKYIAYENMKPIILNEYEAKHPEEISKYKNILEKNIFDINFDDLKGTGYIVDTLESSLYSFMTTNNYKECIKKAISIGVDTDTIACIAGGLSGANYGYYKIPSSWLKTLVKKEEILELCSKYKNFLQ